MRTSIPALTKRADCRWLPRPLDDGDRVFDAVSCQGIADLL